MAVIFTTTRYISRDHRLDLALQASEAAQAMGYEMVVVDSSPKESQTQRDFEERGATFIRQVGEGMGSARRQALQAALATNHETFVWLEPEKSRLVPLLDQSIELIESGSYDLVVPRRQCLDSYPTHQQLCELSGNWQVGNFTGRPDLDLWFGPRLMNRAGAELFLSYDGQYGDRWDSIFVPVARALALGLKVGSSLVDYQHPPSQTIAEEGDAEMNRKRDIQLEELVEAMRIECRKLRLP